MSGDVAPNSADHEPPEGGGLRRFLFLVLLIFGIIMVGLAALAIFAPDSGLLGFNYEGA